MGKLTDRDIDLVSVIDSLERRAKGHTPASINPNCRATLIELEGRDLTLETVTLPHHTSGDYGGGGTLAHANRRHLWDQPWADRLRGAGLLIEREGGWSSVTVLAAALLFGLNPDDDDASRVDSFVEWLGYPEPEPDDDSATPGDLLYADVAELNDYLDKLENYPCANDSLLSEIELEWQDEAWSDYVRAEFRRECEKALAGIRDESEDEDEVIERFLATFDGDAPETSLIELFEEMREQANEEWTTDYNSANINEERLVEKGLSVLTDYFREWDSLEFEKARGTVNHPLLPFPE